MNLMDQLENRGIAALSSQMKPWIPCYSPPGVAGSVKDRAHPVPAASGLGSEHCGIHRHKMKVVVAGKGRIWRGPK